VIARQNAETDYPSRVTDVVATPDRFSSWRDYAFSSAPELVEELDPDQTPARGIPTV